MLSPSVCNMSQISYYSLTGGGTVGTHHKPLTVCVCVCPEENRAEYSWPKPLQQNHYNTLLYPSVLHSLLSSPLILLLLPSFLFSLPPSLFFFSIQAASGLLLLPYALLYSFTPYFLPSSSPSLFILSFPSSSHTFLPPIISLWFTPFLPTFFPSF